MRHVSWCHLKLHWDSPASLPILIHHRSSRLLRFWIFTCGTRCIVDTVVGVGQFRYLYGDLASSGHTAHSWALGSTSVRISVPNIILVTVYIVMGGGSALIIWVSLNASSSDPIWMIVFMGLLLAMLLWGFVVLSYRMKVLILGQSGFTIVFPFRLHARTHKYSDVAQISWQIWEQYRIGDTRQLIFTTAHGQSYSIADLEYWNFDTLEKTLLARTNTLPNLNARDRIRSRQAKANFWFNVISVPLLTVFLFWTVQSLGPRPPTSFRIVSGSILFIILIRVIYRLFQYRSWMKGGRA